MENSTEMSSHSQSSLPDHALQVDFQWKKCKALITNKNDAQSKPIYIVDFHAFKAPHLVLKTAADESIIGTGTLHPVSIDADCEIRGQPVKLKAEKRFKTVYSYYSHAFADSETSKPMLMTWTSSSDWKTWDFICVDEHQNPVGKYSANWWALKKIAHVEFLGERTEVSEKAREEVLIMGLTLCYCMCLRMNNIFNFFGAMFAHTGHDEKERMRTASSEHAVDGKVKAV